ncbi:hypothetical protein [Ramlibacter albus]|uniref:Uncharacterized protein n=1 Tax=Ramlibacter albus TaxID=2079448 RepID=A0A923S559_9BURK|nr:hypothetical protein [Ramlibacter albus]MBC5768319.1 hypothetical protein [Ramlibacter albus]
MLERITGPYRGLYIAAYACPVGEAGQFHGFAKVCGAQPLSYWEATQVVRKLSAPAWSATADEALAAAEEVAQMAIANRVPAKAAETA